MSNIKVSSSVRNPKIIVQQGSPGTSSIVINKGGGDIRNGTPNGVAYAVTSSVLGYATGDPGEVLQINASGVPTFGDIDGGEY